MTSGRYLRSSLPLLTVLALAALLLLYVLLVGGVGLSLSLLACAIVVVGGLLALALDYARKRDFYRDVDDGASSGVHALHAFELLERPEHVEGQLTFEALRAVSKAANDEVAASHRHLQEYREFVEVWVHEAKSPLAAAHLMVENLEGELAAADGVPTDPAVLLQRARMLDEELDRTEGFIEQALFYARSEALDRDYLIRSCCLHDLATHAIKDNARLLISAQVAPVLGELDFQVFTDEKWFHFILGQVIQNSAKYARDEGAQLSFSARLLDAGGAGECVELAVRDNGRGVTAADLPRVFDKGFTGDLGRSGKRSTGIGLYLVKRLCDKMGVEVAADSAQREFFAVMFRFSTNKFHYFE